ncbi:cytochrome P450 [Mycena leptocephala]|nr:cytochrome P450 [Mycena leptocephala]
MDNLKLDDLKPLIQYGALAVVGLALIRNAMRDSKVRTYPSSWKDSIIFYWDAWKFVLDAPNMIQEGYNRYPDGIFRVARLYHWEYIVCGPKLVKEVGNIPENVLSFMPVSRRYQAKHTMGRAIAEDPYHQQTIRTSLTRNLHTQWTSLPVLPTTMSIVSRVSNRLFVGLPLCRNEEYLANNIRHTIDVVRSGTIISLFPEFLRPQEKSNARALKFLGPLLEERLTKERELGPDWDGKPNDLITWLLELAEGDQRTPLDLTLRILGTNMAAIHTSSMAFTHAIFDLTMHPEHLLPMREEAERVVREEGWTKAALNSMVKIDSFLRESQRLNPTGPLVMQRRVVSKDGFRFSDGTMLPQGAFLSVAARPAHFDPSNYENPTAFDGFRFARERAEHISHSDPNDSQDIFKKHMISVGVDHLPFGTGKHACPGRFFAATELKAMLAHLVINYDVKAEVEGVRPPDMNFGTVTTPSATGKVLFRKRQ